jgi:hypothetical protein
MAAIWMPPPFAGQARKATTNRTRPFAQPLPPAAPSSPLPRYDMTLLEVWCIKFSPHPSGAHAPHLPASPRDMCCLGRNLCAMLRLMPLFCSNDRSELLYLLTSSLPLTSKPPSLKDSYDFGGPVDTEGGKLSISVQFSRPASRLPARATSLAAPQSSVSPPATSAANISGSTSAAARPPFHPADVRDSKVSPPIAMLPPKRHSISSPGSAPESAPISSGARRGSLQPSPTSAGVGSLETAGVLGGGSRIFAQAVAVRYAGNGAPAGSSSSSSSSSAPATRLPSAMSSHHHDHLGQVTAGVAGYMIGPSPPQ